MSRRRNGTNRAAAQLGLNPYGWGNGGKRKSPKGVEAPVGANRITNSALIMGQKRGKVKHGRDKN